MTLKWFPSRRCHWWIYNIYFQVIFFNVKSMEQQQQQNRRRKKNNLLWFWDLELFCDYVHYTLILNVIMTHSFWMLSWHTHFEFYHDTLLFNIIMTHSFWMLSWHSFWILSPLCVCVCVHACVMWGLLFSFLWFELLVIVVVFHMWCLKSDVN